MTPGPGRNLEKPSVMLTRAKVPASLAGRKAGRSMEEKPSGKRRASATPEEPRPEDQKSKKVEANETPAIQPTRTVSEMVKRATEIEKKMLAFCLDPAKKVGKENAATVMESFLEMRKIVDALTLKNSFLCGKLEERLSSSDEAKAALTGAASRTMEATKRLESAAKGATASAAGSGQISYADKLKVSSRVLPKSAIMPPKDVVIITPSLEDTDIRTSEEAREAVFTLVNSKKRGIKVKSVRRAQGNGIAVETTTAEGLRAFTENAKLKVIGLKARTPTRSRQRMIIYDIPRELTEKEIRACLRKQNKEKLGDADVQDIKFCFRTGRKDSDETYWVVEVSPQIRSKVISGKFFISWNACKVRDFIAVSRCYKCEGFGHVAKHSRQKHDTCGHCAETGHDTKACPTKKNNAVCVNCKRSGKKSDHAASSVNCPSYKAALERTVERTVYG
ncbi:PREDICTED: uncharacterized protein LOC108554690 [Eufriesea mexicana]|uniref:uncharacterized protein LOC108554690 n=1 Tax=Eufriesea mexicana TaxID=516756 RepID=UPI00083BD6EF|nr:PREDICTED: uncharacterized protein LOC108554690 [Eufriesea mexicana]